jgi:hypothetical protein
MAQCKSMMKNSDRSDELIQDLDRSELKEIVMTTVFLILKRNWNNLKTFLENYPIIKP